MKSPKEVMETTTPQIKSLISNILKFETEFQHFLNLPKEKERELCTRIAKLIDKEVPDEN